MKTLPVHRAARGLLLVALVGGCEGSTASVSDGGTSDLAGSAGSDLAGSAGSDLASASSDGGASACTADPATAANAAAVLAAANAFLAALTQQQKTAAVLDHTLAHARQWSNLPTTFVSRNGVKISDMSQAAQTAAIALATAAASTTGSTLLAELRAADQWLVSDGKASATDYGTGLYYFSFIGTPSANSPWMLQIAGHHLAYNFSYGSKCTSASPLFDGVEPTSWTDANVKHAPLEGQRAAVVALLQSVAGNADAKLSGTYNDLIAGPTGMTGDANYPTKIPYPTGATGRGVLVSSLSAQQQALVKAVIEAWVKNAGESVATSLLSSYESADAFAQTYVGYSGSTDLTTQASYARIDGPRVWIEFTVQGGIVYRNQVHYHTIWRDKVADYGAEYN